MRLLPRVNYRLDISEETLAQLRALPKEARRRIGFRLDALQDDLQGDVKKLAGQAGRYRLRVGEYRVPFALEKT
jgi:mRNA interferase RelE/StbE